MLRSERSERSHKRQTTDSSSPPNFPGPRETWRRTASMLTRCKRTLLNHVLNQLMPWLIDQVSQSDNQPLEDRTQAA